MRHHGCIPFSHEQPPFPSEPQPNAPVICTLPGYIGADVRYRRREAHAVVHACNRLRRLLQPLRRVQTKFNRFRLGFMKRIPSLYDAARCGNEACGCGHGSHRCISCHTGRVTVMASATIIVFNDNAVELTCRRRLRRNIRTLACSIAQGRVAKQLSEGQVWKVNNRDMHCKHSAATTAAAFTHTETSDASLLALGDDAPALQAPPDTSCVSTTCGIASHLTSPPT